MEYVFDAVLVLVAYIISECIMRKKFGLELIFMDIHDIEKDIRALKNAGEIAFLEVEA